jgi:FkbM family methyltransferase
MQQLSYGVPDLIYDVGMNKAEDTQYYLAKGFRVVAIEANPAMVEDAQKRFASQIADGQLTIVPQAVAERRGSIRFFVCKTMSAWSTTDQFLVEQQRRAGADFEEITVGAVPFAGILREYKVPHYLKIDIEGSDLLCLHALDGFSERPRSISVEVSFYNHTQLIAIAKKLGYTGFQVISQESVKLQRQPVPAKEGKTIAYQFQRGCSGLFGLDLPDEWISAQKALTRLNWIRWQHKCVGAMRRFGRLFGVEEPAVKLGREVFPMTADWYDLHMTIQP